MQNVHKTSMSWPKATLKVEHCQDTTLDMEEINLRQISDHEAKSLLLSKQGTLLTATMTTLEPEAAHAYFSTGTSQTYFVDEKPQELCPDRYPAVLKAKPLLKCRDVVRRYEFHMPFVEVRVLESDKPKTTKRFRAFYEVDFSQFKTDE